MAVFNPPIPYTGAVNGGCFAGALFQINGFIPHHARRFEFNLKTGHGDIALHINPRFEDGQIVLNTCQHGNWGSEQRCSIGSLQRGHPFELKVLVEHQRFLVALNGQHHTEYNHRVPKESITLFEVAGDVQIQIVSQVGAGSSAPALAAPPFPGFPPAFSPAVPFNLPIHGGFVPGRRIIVYGTITGNGFSINLQNGPEPMNNVALHVNPRINENAVVLNDRFEGHWGSEQRFGNTLHAGQPFSLEIVCHQHGYEIRVNSNSAAVFQHRNIQNRPLHRVDHLFINGEVQLTQIIQ